ncbi:uncharacterized protein L201_006437 [Kwoniella dendrophila CBS 6074]|uniref:Uncharacterized protein n=1 Tax=Kwoniella dendrophila CBS 6074 TaxID=1295534 RepID=A0AAX4K1P0_9TREE
MVKITTVLTFGYALFACIAAGSASDDHVYPTSSYNLDYLFTITYAFGGASPIVRTNSVAENMNRFVGAGIEGPALNGSIDSGEISNKFVPYGNKTIVYEEAAWFGTFDNGDKGNGTLIARGTGLVDYDGYEQQRVILTLDQGDHDYLQYIFILCGSIVFDLKTASAKQDCFRAYYGNPVSLPPVFG